jgi:uncharacterized protein (TIGR02466 family)
MKIRPLKSKAPEKSNIDSVSHAASLLHKGRHRDAMMLLQQVLVSTPQRADGHHLLGILLNRMGDYAGAEYELCEAARLAPGNAAPIEALVGFFIAQGRREDALATYRTMLAHADGNPSGHPRAEFGLAVFLERLGRETDAEASCHRAIIKGFDSGEAWSFLGRLYHKQGRLDDAEAALRNGVRCEPGSTQLNYELAQLVWMRTGDLTRARAVLDQAPQTTEIASATIKLLQWTGDEQAAYQFAAARAKRDPRLHVLAARIMVGSEPQLAERHLAMAPLKSFARAKCEIEIDLALGRADQAAQRAEMLHSAHSNNHAVTALLTTAWRLAGNKRYSELCDYNRLVGIYRIDTPTGWQNLEAYLTDLALALDRVHRHCAHPIGQSLRQGSQTPRDLSEYPDREIKALFRAIDGPIRHYINAFAINQYRIHSAWSVRLSNGGFHTDHVHPEGWLSSAFYVRVPQALKHQEGWLQFGQPGTPTAPVLPAEYIVKPEPGLLVLFPSYIWHGTVPFASTETRLSCAFDIVPA